MIVWEAPGPYRVGFTTRAGGVSGGAFASLNLGGRGDDPGAVRANRAIACRELGLDPGRLAVNRQQHTAKVNRAAGGVEAAIGDALWTDEPALPLLALGADCLPIAIVSTSGRPSLAVVHAGWRGLAEGIVEASVAALEAPACAAMIGPGIGPCCYSVGEEVAERFEPELTRGGRLDLWEGAARALARAGVEQVECAELCTHCNPGLLFSHRASAGGPHGSQGVIGALEP